MFIYRDKYGNTLDSVKFIECAWNLKWSECGDFMLYISAADWNPNIKYIQNKIDATSPSPDDILYETKIKTGIVQKIVFEKKIEGDFITASGFFIEKCLSWAANALPHIINSVGTGGGPEYVGELLSLYVTDMFATVDKGGEYSSLYKIDASFPFAPDTINSNIEVGTPVGDFLYDLLPSLGITIHCDPIFNAPAKESTQPLLGLKLTSMKGIDRGDKVFFSAALKDVSDISYTLDESADRTIYATVQDIETPTGFTDVQSINTADGIKHYIFEKYVEEANKPGDMGNVYPSKVLTTSVSNIEMVAANQAEIRGQMRSQAKLDMLNNYKIETISATILQNYFYYGKDYGLGTIVTLAIDELEQMFTARIVEVHLYYKDDQETVEIVLGTPKKAKYLHMQA